MTPRALPGLRDCARSGRPRAFDHSQIISTTLKPPPPKLGVSHWSSRLLAKHLEISFAAVPRAWRDYEVHTIATRYARDFHRRVCRREGPITAEGHQRLPVAFVPLSAGITLKGLNQQILQFYGHPAADKASTSRLGALAVDGVTGCETRLIVIDDLHFVNFRHRSGIDVSNHLKGLANEMAATFIYVGVQLRERRFFDEGLVGEQAAFAQTSRRAIRCPVAPFAIDTDAGLRGWISLLKATERHIKLAEAHSGMLVEHAKELHRRSPRPHRFTDQPAPSSSRCHKRRIHSRTAIVAADVRQAVTACQAASPRVWLWPFPRWCGHERDRPQTSQISMQK